jgi:hypothetical protein
MDACLSSTILVWPLFWEFLQLFYLHFVEYFSGLVFLLGFFTYVDKKSEGRCIHEGFFSFSFLFSADQTHKFSAPPSQAQWQRAGRTFTCKSPGLEPRPFLEVPGSQRGAIPLSHDPSDAFIRFLAFTSYRL